jgi:hypothetical protein
MKIMVPIGTQSEVKARTRLSELRGMYKEDITIDNQSGEITINGQPNFSFAKTYIIPTKAGEQTEISSFAPEGYDLSNTDALKYFWLRFIVETKVPNNRFSLSLEGGDGGGKFESGAEGASREEMRFSYFINRIRSIFQDILLKPTWIQFCLKHDEFTKDQSLKGSIGLLYKDENLFKIAKEREIANKGAETVVGLMGVKSPTILPDGTIGEEDYFDPKFLVEKFMTFNDTDTMLNDKYVKERKDQMKKLAAAYKRLAEIEGGGTSEGGGGAENTFGGGMFGGGGGAEETTPETPAPTGGPEAAPETGGGAPAGGGEAFNV